jgi:hypothetical protein
MVRIGPLKIKIKKADWIGENDWKNQEMIFRVNIIAKNK